MYGFKTYGDYIYWIGKTDNNADENNDSSADDGGPGKGKNKGANNKGIGTNLKQMTVFGMSGITFFGAPVRLIPYDFETSSYVGGALNIYVGNWKKFLEDPKGLSSAEGKHLMHKYGHYLQVLILYGEIDYITKVAIPSLTTNGKSMHEHALNPVEMEASTLAYYYFGKPEGFIKDFNYLNPCISCTNRISHSIAEKWLMNAYKYHTDYKEN